MMHNRYLALGPRARFRFSAAPDDQRNDTFVMPENRLFASARRRTIALTLAAGAALGLMTATALTTAMPAVADSVDQSGTASDTQKAQADAVIETGRTALASAVSTAGEMHASGFDLGDTVDASIRLVKAMNSLSNSIDEIQESDEADRTAQIAAVHVHADLLTAQSAALQGQLDAAVAQKKAEDEAAAAAAAAAEAEAAAAQAAALAAANTPAGARAVAAQIASSQYGWGDGEFSCLDSLWTKESGWDYQAYNQDGGATGIPQALPGDKMASFGDDWQTNAETQIRWGLDYISSVYGTPCSAWGHSQSVNWY